MNRISPKWASSIVVSLLFFAALAPIASISTHEALFPVPGASFQVVRAHFETPTQVWELARFIEPWEVHYDDGYVVIGATPTQIKEMEKLGFRVEIDEVLTDTLSKAPQKLPGQTSGIPGYPCYRTVEESIASAVTLASTYPHLVSLVDIGDSWDKAYPMDAPGYDLLVLKLTNKTIAIPKPKFFIMASVHAREFSPAELSLRFAEYLLQNYNAQADITWLLDYQEVHILFQANPDGRKYAEQGVLWRKNTNQNYCSPTSYSRGADLNRNFSFQWNCCGGSSNYGCDETYHGASAASEPETQAIENYVRTQFPDQRGENLSDPAPSDAWGVFLDLHSYSNLVLWPWGFTTDMPPNNAALRTLGRKLAFFNGYQPMQAISLYPTDGTTNDFAYGELGLATYTFEIGNSFFEPCTNFENTILPTNLAALTYAFKASNLPYLWPAGPEVLDVQVIPAHALPGENITLMAIADDTRYNHDNGSEAVQTIQAAEVYLDFPYWIESFTPISYTLNASDGAFDQDIELLTLTLDTSTWTLGRHILYLRAQDAAGNWGVPTAIYLFLGWDIFFPWVAR